MEKSRSSASGVRPLPWKERTGWLRYGPAARPDRGHVSPLSYVAVSAVVSVLLFVFFLAGERGFLQVRSQKAQIGALEKDVAALAERNEKLEKQIVRLKTDPAAVEGIAREELQLVKPGDVVILLPPGWEKQVGPPEKGAAPPTSSPASASASSPAPSTDALARKP